MNLNIFNWVEVKLFFIEYPNILYFSVQSLPFYSIVNSGLHHNYLHVPTLKNRKWYNQVLSLINLDIFNWMSLLKITFY